MFHTLPDEVKGFGNGVSGGDGIVVRLEDEVDFAELDPTAGIEVAGR